MKRGSSRRLREQPIPSSFSILLSVWTVWSMTRLLPSNDHVGDQRMRCLDRLAAHLRRRVLNRFHDVLIARAAAEIARHPVTYLLLRRVWILLQQPVGAGDHARRAEAALQPVLLHEPFL